MPTKVPKGIDPEIYKGLPNYLSYLRDNGGEDLKNLVLSDPNVSKYNKGIIDSSGNVNYDIALKAVTDGKGGYFTDALISNYYNMLNERGKKNYPIDTIPSYSSMYESGRISDVSSDNITKFIGGIQKNTVQSTNDKDSILNNGAFLSNVGSGLRAFAAAMMAKDGMPSWIEPYAFKQNLADLETRTRAGLTAEEKSYANMMRDRMASMAYNQVNSLGGGGSKGSVLAALSGVNKSVFDSTYNTILADSEKRSRNQEIYTRAVGDAVNIDRMKYRDAYNKDSARQLMAYSTIAANLKDIQDRNDYEKQYGEGSIYRKLQSAYLRNIQLNNAAADLALKQYR